MQDKIKALIKETLQKLQAKDIVARDLELDSIIQLSRPRDDTHGDFASNIALILAKKLQTNPRDLATAILENISKTNYLDKVEIAGPGFINFHLTKQNLNKIVGAILDEKEHFGCSDLGKDKSAIVEFVSANPTGPLHVGHGRGAAYGATCADLLAAVGYKVHREYYVNDAGRQMNILAISSWLRYLELSGEKLHFPAAGYKGNYIINVAQNLKSEFKESLRRLPSELYQDMPEDETGGGDKDFYVDSLIARAKDLLGEDLFDQLRERTLTPILADIREDLEEFGVVFQEWFSEKHLLKNGYITKALAKLNELGHLYEKDDATWFAASKFGDEKDRVVIRANGSYTYFASDIAYHLNKFERGFDLIIDVLGSDHHGYAPRIIALFKALGLDYSRFNVLLVQFAILYRGKTKVQMSTRSGKFVTLRELRKEVGNDAARFFYIMRNHKQHMDFDLELAKSTSMDNPIFYIQYAHARISSVMRKANDQGVVLNQENGLNNLELLKGDSETKLIRTLSRYTEVVEKAALEFDPQLLAVFLQELAMHFHSYYNAEMFLVENAELRDARLCLIKAAKQVLFNGLHLLGVNAPEVM